jgi:hypothetical protein
MSKLVSFKVQGRPWDHGTINNKNCLSVFKYLPDHKTMELWTRGLSRLCVCHILKQTMRPCIYQINSCVSASLNLPLTMRPWTPWTRLLSRLCVFHISRQTMWPWTHSDQKRLECLQIFPWPWDHGLCYLADLVQITFWGRPCDHGLIQTKNG